MQNYINESKCLTCAFTVDVEDGISIAMRDTFGIVTQQTNRVVQSTTAILDLLEKYNVKGTFFILGKVAEDFPNLVKAISKGGHEIGVHGYNHLQFYRMTPQLAKEELTSAKSILQDLTGESVIGHRAPAFSISPKTSWAFDILVECGFKYDSSIMPIKSERYGWPNFPEKLCVIKTTSGNEIIEAPIKSFQFLGGKIPFSGGSYLRLMPLILLKKLFSLNNIYGKGNILYIHPYELDTERYPDYYFKALNSKPIRTQLKMRSMWLNRNQTANKLEFLLKTFRFSNLIDIIDYNNKLEVFPIFSIQQLENNSLK
ncbi:MAG: DUF3473 domain-containing protein [Bacteroidetes bacterium]|nr:DUF3473 domain-containing protein [Bacteroidota bacterium]